MKRLKIISTLFILILFILLAFGTTAFAKSAIIGFTALTGGGTGALDAVECEDILGDNTNRAIATGDFAIGMTSDKDFYFYRYNASGTSSESSPDIIVPDDRAANCAGNGQWELLRSINVARSATPQTVYRDSDCTDKDDNVYWTVNCTNTGSGTENCDISLFVQIAGTATEVFKIDADGSSGAIATINGTAPNSVDGSVALFTSTLNSTTNTTHGLYSFAMVSPASSSTQEYSAGLMFAGSSSANLASGSTVIGGRGVSYYSGSNPNTMPKGIGGEFLTYLNGTGTITTAIGGSFTNANTGTGTITNAYQAYISNPTNSGGGTITNNTGIYIANQTAGSSSNYSLYAAGGNAYVNGDFDLGSGKTYKINGTDYKDVSVTFTNKTIDAEGTGNSITIPVKIWLAAAGCNNATASSFWDLPTSEPAGVACVTGTNIQKGVLDFEDGTSTTAESAQTYLMLPSDFSASGNLDVVIKWFAAAITGSVVWGVQTSCVADAETDDPSWNTASTATDAAKGTTLQTNDATISNVTKTGCAAGELMHLKIYRDADNASDTMSGDARLIGVEVTYRRAM